MKLLWKEALRSKVNLRESVVDRKRRGAKGERDGGLTGGKTNANSMETKSGENQTKKKGEKANQAHRSKKLKFDHLDHRDQRVSSEVLCKGRKKRSGTSGKPYWPR